MFANHGTSDGCERSGPGWTNARHSGGGAYATHQAELSRVSFSRVVEACERCEHRTAGCGFMSEAACGGWNICWLCCCGLMHDAVGSWFRIPLVSQAPVRNRLASRLGTIGEKQDGG